MRHAPPCRARNNSTSRPSHYLPSTKRRPGSTGAEAYRNELWKLFGKEPRVYRVDRDVSNGDENMEVGAGVLEKEELTRSVFHIQDCIVEKDILGERKRLATKEDEKFDIHTDHGFLASCE